MIDHKPCKIQDLLLRNGLMNASPPAVILIGKRNGALRAARNLGLKTKIVDPSAEEGAELPGPPIRAVVAVTEATVLKAAEIRASFGLPGLTPEAAKRCTDKLAMKQAIRAAGIPCASFVPVPAGQTDAEALFNKLGKPLILKQQCGYGGRGTVIASEPGELPASIEVPSLAESFVAGIEMSVESLVVDGAPVFVNLTQYVEPAWSSLLPAELDEATKAALHDINARSIAALGVERGMTHMEVFLTKDGIVFGELAARPPGGQIMSLIAEAYRFDPWEALLAIEIGEPDRVAVPEAALQCAAMRFIHPGAGTVTSIQGLDEIRELPTLQELSCKLTAGDEVPPREGTGQHRGFVIFSGEPGQVRRDLKQFRKLLRIGME